MALQLIQILFSSNRDWKESIPQQNVSFARLKFAEWRSALIENGSLNWDNVNRNLRDQTKTIFTIHHKHGLYNISLQKLNDSKSECLINKCTSLKDFHKLISTFLPLHFSRLHPKTIYYRNYKKLMSKSFSKMLKIQASVLIQKTQTTIMN